MGLAGLTGHVECAKTQRFCKMTDLTALTGLTGLTGHAEVDFGVREMYKNPTLLTTLTGLTGLTGLTVLTDRSRAVSRKSDVPECSKTQHF